jgi:hypothetical protein
MTRFGRIATTMNWRYAVGEVVLIVIGVSIALAASSWWEERQEREEEQAILRQISSALQVDLERFEEAQKQHLQQETDIITLIEHMEGDEPYHPGMSPLFRSVRRWIQMAPSTGPYEALKNRGHELISNDELLSRIIYYYEQQATGIIKAALNDRDFVVSRLHPYMDVHFRSVDPRTIVPLDYEDLRRDNYFRSLVMMKLLRLQDRILVHYQATNRMIRELLDAIDLELDGTT